MAGRLDGRVALVTGGSRGIGRAICLRLAREDATVIVNYTQQADAASAVVDEIRNGGGRAAAIQADVSNRAAVEAMVHQATTDHGAIDILVNNAGILSRGTALTLDDEEFDRMFAVNVKGIINAVRAAVPAMVTRRYGRIVNIASLAGLGTAVPETTPYAVTKAAVNLLTKRQAFELGAHGITVNAICPGFVTTDMLGSLEKHEDDSRRLALAAKAVLNRVGAPDDIAGVAAFLASDDASFMTGQILTVDGGRTDFLSASA